MADECATSFEEDGEMWSDYREEMCVSDGSTFCEECSVKIPLGHPYMHASGINDDGDERSFIACVPCQQIVREFFEGDWCFGVIWDRFQDLWADGMPVQTCMNRVHTVVAKQKLRERWLLWKGLALS